MARLYGCVNPNIQFSNCTMLILFYKVVILLFLPSVHYHFGICKVVILSTLLGFHHFFQYMNWHVEPRRSKQSQVF